MLRQTVIYILTIISVFSVFCVPSLAMGILPTPPRPVYNETLKKPGFDLATIKKCNYEISSIEDGKREQPPLSLTTQNLQEEFKLLLKEKGFNISSEGVSEEGLFDVLYSSRPFTYKVPTYGSIWLPEGKNEIIGKSISVPIGQEDREENMYRIYMKLYRLLPQKDGWFKLDEVWEGYAADTATPPGLTTSIEPPISVYKRLLRALVDKILSQ